jgi:hypothetical protein
MSVSPPLSVISAYFITFNSVSRVVSWYTNSNDYAGTYIITIIGKILANSAFQSNLTFILNVTASCSGSTEGN